MHSLLPPMKSFYCCCRCGAQAEVPDFPYPFSERPKGWVFVTLKRGFFEMSANFCSQDCTISGQQLLFAALDHQEERAAKEAASLEKNKVKL